MFSLALLSVGPDGPLFEVPSGWPQPTYDFTKNPLAREKVELGRALFYDPILSRDGTISCSSCHLSYTGFTHIDHKTSHGIGNRLGLRNSLALVNLAWNKSFMWDGAVQHLDMQALAPISHPDEMGEDFGHLVEKLAATARYPPLFERAFGEGGVTGERVLKSLAQFELTIVSAGSRYDRMARGEIKFNEWEDRGYSIFKKHCNSCHAEPLFTDFSFENNGLAPDSLLNDGGRIRVTRQAADSLRFRVPSLRNCEVTGPYMHDGRIENLAMVIFHYTEGIHDGPFLSQKLRSKISLSEEDKNCLAAFLRTLTDEKFLHDERFQFPRN